MRIVTNTKLATRNKSIANYLFIVTLVLLVGGFFFVNTNFLTTEEGINPLILLVQTLILPIAFLMTLVSIRMTNLWARPPRPDAVLPESLKGLSKKSILYNYFHIPARHILISPQGIWVIVTRWHDGSYTVDGDKWKTNANFLTRFFSSLRMDGIGNPTLDAQRAAEHAQKLLSAHAPNAVVKPIILFLNSKAEVNIVNSAIPIVFLDSKKKPSLKDFMRDEYTALPGVEGKKNQLPITDEQIASFERATAPNA